MDQLQVAAQTRGDVTGDGRQDSIYLSGTQQAGGISWENLVLHIVDGATAQETCIRLREDAGYSPRLFLGHFTSPQRLDMLVSVDSGGSGGIGYYTIYGFENDAVRRFFDSESYNAAFQYAVHYQNGCAVRADSLSNRQTYLIDISARGNEYLQAIYRKDGTLIKPQEGFVDPLSLLYPADIDGDGLLELVAYQRISGLYHADALGDFINTLRWNGQKYELSSQTVGIFPVPVTSR